MSHFNLMKQKQKKAEELRDVIKNAAHNLYSEATFFVANAHAWSSSKERKTPFDNFIDIAHWFSREYAILLSVEKEIPGLMDDPTIYSAWENVSATNPYLVAHRNYSQKVLISSNLLAPKISSYMFEEEKQMLVDGLTIVQCCLRSIVERVEKGPWSNHRNSEWYVDLRRKMEKSRTSMILAEYQGWKESPNGYSRMDAYFDLFNIADCFNALAQALRTGDHLKDVPTDLWFKTKQLANSEYLHRGPEENGVDMEAWLLDVASIRSFAMGVHRKFR